MGNDQRRVPFLAPVFAEAAAPVADAVGRAAAAAIAALGVDVLDVPCPVCAEVVAMLVSRRLYLPGGDLGHPLGGPESTVYLPCPCGRLWRTSGRKVARNLHNGRPAISA
jgi:hypothetical protein